MTDLITTGDLGRTEASTTSTHDLTETTRSSTMHLLNEELARAQQHERLEAAHQLHLVRQKQAARKADRKSVV